MPIPMILASLGGAVLGTAVTSFVAPLWARDDDEEDDDYDEEDDEDMEVAQADWEETEDLFEYDDDDRKARKKAKKRARKAQAAQAAKRARKKAKKAAKRQAERGEQEAPVSTPHPEVPFMTGDFTEKTVFAVGKRFGVSKAVVRFGLAQIDVRVDDLVLLANALSFTEASATRTIQHLGGIAKVMADQMGVPVSEIPNRLKGFAAEMQAAHASSSDSETIEEEETEEPQQAVAEG